MLWEQIVVGILILASLAFTVRSLARTLAARRSGCRECPVADCCANVHAGEEQKCPSDVEKKPIGKEGEEEQAG